MNKMKYQRKQLGAFVVYVANAGSGAEQIVKVRGPHRRIDHAAVVAVIAGKGKLISPKSEWPITAGMVDDELPDYDSAGDFVYRADASGLKFFCVSRVDKKLPVRQKILTNRPFTVPQGSIFVCVSGMATVSTAEALSPFIVDATQQDKRVVPNNSIKGVIIT